NRCPPMSKRQPSRTAVRLIPPTTASDSSTVGATPRFVSMYAAVSPAGPAPMMTTSCSADGSGWGVGSLTGRVSGRVRRGRRRAGAQLRAPAVYGPASLAPGPGPSFGPRRSGPRDPGERQHGVPDETGGGDHVRPAFQLVAVGDDGQREQE